MSKRRGGVGVGAVNGCLYALGGHDAPATNPNASRYDCVERYVYVYETREWSNYDRKVDMGINIFFMIFDNY